MALTTFTITNDGQFLIITSSVGTEESINLDAIKDIHTEFIPNIPGTYPFTDMKIITIETNGRQPDFRFDLEAVTNQAAWTFNQAGCNQAQLDIRGWLNAAATGSGLATEATLSSLLGEVSGSVQRAVSYSTITGIANSSVGAGARSISFFNDGPTNAVIQGNILLPGKGIEFSAGGENDTLAAVTYVTIATGSLDISTIV